MAQVLAMDVPAYQHSCAHTEPLLDALAKHSDALWDNYGINKDILVSANTYAQAD